MEIIGQERGEMRESYYCETQYISRYHNKIRYSNDSKNIDRVSGNYYSSRNNRQEWEDRVMCEKEHMRVRKCK